MPTLRRWFAFRLRTLFVVVALISPLLAWAGYSLNWIRQRNTAILSGGLMWNPCGPQVKPPLLLRPFGETAYGLLDWVDARRISRDEVATLFPEAMVNDFSKSPHIRRLP
jgi:hypothetical protein